MIASLLIGILIGMGVGPSRPSRYVASPDPPMSKPPRFAVPPSPPPTPRFPDADTRRN